MIWPNPFRLHVAPGCPLRRRDDSKQIDGPATRGVTAGLLVKGRRRRISATGSPGRDGSARANAA